jgi:hypothetical protein
MGSIAEPGVTPRFCAELFSRIDAWEAEDVWLSDVYLWLYFVLCPKAMH